ncbi:MAG: efflux RND transporter permease subunit [Halieaceae bacterium]|nr:efflux RND transporter permease subunit [Halieaceae bacterium]
MIAWFVRNPIAANLLMVLIIVGGFTGVPALEKQFFPEIELNMVSVSMPYLGAGPGEVEEQICVRIEEAVHDLNGVKEIRSTAREGMGTVLVEAERGYDMQRLTAEVKTRVDAITTFPAEAERPIITELAHRRHMVSVTVAGDIGEENLKALAETLRDDLAAQPYVSVVEVISPRPYEVSVEVSEYTLRRYGLRFDDVVRAIQTSSLNLPAGTIKAETGDIRLQTRGQAYERADFENIVLVSKRDGTRVLLGDVATVIDGFEDMDVRSRLNDTPSHELQVFVTSRPNVLLTSESVARWVEEATPRLPEGVSLTMWRDQSVPFASRVETLVKNGVGGLILVFAVLVLFLRPMLAIWVCVGIAVAFLGTFFILPYTGVRLHMISLFAFLLILGIVVDDAIIVGESIHSRQTSGDLGDHGAILGAQGVVKPVMFAVISTMIFFAPMWFMPGDMADVAKSIPTVVTLALAFSLVECMLILPAHLAHMRPVKPARSGWLASLERSRERCADAMVSFAANRYRPFLERSLSRNLLTLSLFFVSLLLTLSIYAGGWIKSGFFPSVTSDWVVAQVELKEGIAFQDTLDRLQQVEAAAIRTKQAYNSRDELNREGPVIGLINSRGRDNQIDVWMELENKDVNIAEVSEYWREQIDDLGEVEDFTLDYTIRDDDEPIRLVLASPSVEDLQSVAEELRATLLSYPGVYNVNDSLQAPREEIELDLKPAAENLGITLADLAQQVRRAFYGAEAQRIPRTREDVKVMVRYPEQERVSVDNLNEMRIRTPDGREVPFETVAEVRYVSGYQTIERKDRKRTLEVTAEVQEGKSSPRAVVDEILRRDLPRWRTLYPGLSMALDGELQEQQEFSAALIKYMGLSMLIIYGLMAIPFRSYWQPVLILTAIPFGIMGAIWGHIIMGREISMFSLMGVLACAGVVVNDNLVLIDRINQLRAQGLSVLESLLQGGQDRFRPIILTSLTTFIGLLPIMSETSVQAQFLIPMVISLAFGVLFATAVTLLLVPALYLFGEQFQDKFIRRKRPVLRSGESPRESVQGA